MLFRSGPFPSTTVEDELDEAAQRDAKLQSEINRSIRVPKTDTESTDELVLPIDSSRASKFLGFDANGALSLSAVSGSGGLTAAAGDDGKVLTPLSTILSWNDYINGNLMVGTNASPDGTLHVHTAAAGSVSADLDSDDLVVENGANTGISILSPGGGSDCFLTFGDAADNNIGRIQYDHGNDAMIFRTNAVDAINIDSNQDIHIGGTSPSARLHVTENAVVTAAVFEAILAGSGGSPIVKLYKNSSSPADNDELGVIQFRGNTDDGAGGVTTSDFLYGIFDMKVVDSSDSTEDAQFRFRPTIAGGASNGFIIGAGFFAGGATGGDQGADSINAKTYFVDGSAGADFGPSAVSSITVVKGIVTAIS